MGCSLSKQQASLMMFLAINVLFLFKYLGRFNLAVASLVCVLYVCSAIFLTKLFNNKKWQVKPWVWITAIVLYVAVHLVLYVVISKESIHVDRWSVITSFWDSAMAGDYPYYARSFDGNNPGPMPFYFCLAFPFYLIGEIGFFSLSGLLLIVWFFYKKKGKEEFTYSLALLLTSAAIFWEMSTRSAIFINSVLILILIYYIKDIDKLSKRLFWLTAVTGGLLLSTRAIFSLVFLVWGIYVLKSKLIPFSRLFQWCLVFFVCFLLTFLPFVCFYYDDFLQMNPFIIQSSFLLPSYVIPVLFIIAGVGGFLCKKGTDVLFYGGLSLFLSVLIYFMYHAVQFELSETLFGRQIDISYFIFSIPFLLFAASTQLAGNNDVKPTR